MSESHVYVKAGAQVHRGHGSALNPSRQFEAARCETFDDGLGFKKAEEALCWRNLAIAKSSLDLSQFLAPRVSFIRMDLRKPL